MEAKINIITTNNVITINETIDFDPVELPYGAKGYKFNGSSMSSKDNLDKYWFFVDQVFAQSQIDISEYVTLQNITIGENLYGVESFS